MDLNQIRYLKKEALEVLDGIIPYASDKHTPNLFFPSLGISLKKDKNVVENHQENQKNYKLSINVAYKYYIPFVKLQLKANKHIKLENIDFEVTGRLKPLYGSGAQIAHHKSWSKNNTNYGTLGCFVRKKDEKDKSLFILGCNHVIANLNKAIENDPIFYIDKKTNEVKKRQIFGSVFDYFSSKDRFETTEIALFKKCIKLDFSDKFTQNVDAAIAIVKDNGNLEEVISNNKTPKFTGFHKSDNIINLVNNGEVFKVGATSGKTIGQIIQAEIDGFSLPYNCGLFGKRANFSNVFKIKGTETDGQGNEKPFSQPGDSGSIVYDKDNNIIGLIFGGNEKYNVTFAIPIEIVFKALEIELPI